MGQSRQFTVKLTVNGKSYTQPIVVKQDPRVKTPALAMQQVYTLSKATYYGAVDAQAAARAGACAPRADRQAPSARERRRGRRAGGAGQEARSARADAAGAGGGARPGGRGGGGGGGRGGGACGTAGIAQRRERRAGRRDEPAAGCGRPSDTVQLNAIASARTTAATTMAKWAAIKTGDMVSTNTALKAAGLAVLTLTTTPAAAPTHATGRRAAAVQQASASDRADALSEAARRGDAAKVKELLDAGVDVNTKFRYDRMALSFAADRGHVEVVKLLVERGADLNAKDTFYNATP